MMAQACAVHFPCHTSDEERQLYPGSDVPWATAWSGGFVPQLADFPILLRDSRARSYDCAVHIAVTTAPRVDPSQSAVGCTAVMLSAIKQSFVIRNLSPSGTPPCGRRSSRAI